MRIRAAVVALGLAAAVGCGGGSPTKAPAGEGPGGGGKQVPPGGFEDKTVGGGERGKQTPAPAAGEGSKVKQD